METSESVFFLKQLLLVSECYVALREPHGIPSQATLLLVSAVDLCYGRVSPPAMNHRALKARACPEYQIHS